MMDSIFQHGVASGDPLQDRAILWTRLTVPAGEDQQLAWAIAADPHFRNVVGSGTAIACADEDHTVHVDATGLQPGLNYYYRFHAFGQTSPVGRTKTLPRDNTGHIRFAQACGASFRAGYFNAYARIADRTDLDFLLHLGNYIHETADIPSDEAASADLSRSFEPTHECQTLEDYRTRYNLYRRDPDVQRMHASLPMLATVDEHDLAAGAWRGGARLHDTRSNGPWGERVRAALRARMEWLPIRLPDPADLFRVHRTVHLGELADLYILDTHIHRDEPVPPPDMFDPNRSALGFAQRTWLFEELVCSTATWRILGGPSMLGSTWKRDMTESARQLLLRSGLIAAEGRSPNYDQWDGYPAERYLLMRRIRDHRLGNFVALSGGSQIGLAQELTLNPLIFLDQAIAVECVNASIPSPGFNEGVICEPGTSALDYERELRGLFPGMKHVSLGHHGYNLVDITPERVLVEWWHVDTVLQRTHKEWRGAAFQIASGIPALVPVE